jgi:cell division protein FtsW
VIRHRFDPVLSGLLLVAIFAGAFVVWDAAFPKAILRGQGVVPVEFLKHLLGLALGCAAFAYFGNFTHGRLVLWGKALFWIGLLLCVLVLVPGIGNDMSTGAYRWLGIGNFSFQPAELLKPATILFLACWIRKSFPMFSPRTRNWVEWMDGKFVPACARAFPLLMVFVGFVLVEQEPDLGTAVVILAIVGGMLLFGLGKHLFERHYIRIVSVLCIVCVGGVFLMAVARSYRADRMSAHANRWDKANIDGVGFQPAQAELAMAFGGPAGVGIAQGRAKHILPAATTDFVSVTPFEEFGLFGSLFIILLLAGISLRLLYLAAAVDDPFRRMAVQGTGWWIGVQSIANLLMAGAAIPAVGIPLPFFSYGNSSLLALGIALGACKAALAPKRAEAQHAPGRQRRRHRRPRLSRA